MTNTSLVPSTQGGAVSQYGEAARNDLSFLREVYLKKGTEQQFRLLMAFGAAKGLDLVAKDYYGIIYMVKNPDNPNGPKIPQMSIQIGIDGYRKAAARTGEYESTEAPLWCGPDGDWMEIWPDDRVPPYACKVGVWVKGARHATYATCKYSEYVQTTPGWSPGLPPGSKPDIQIPNEMWQKMPANQLAKCTEGQALRKAAPAMLAFLGKDFDEVVDTRGLSPASLRPQLGDEVFDGSEAVPEAQAPTKRPRTPIQQPRAKTATERKQEEPPADIGQFVEVPDFDDDATATVVPQDFREDRPMDWKRDANWFWGKAKEYGYSAAQLHEHLDVKSVKELNLTVLQAEALLDGLNPEKGVTGEAVPVCALCDYPATRRFESQPYCKDHAPSLFFTEENEEPL